MELRHLRYYIAVAEALNFTRAAEKLHVAQPALSKQVQDLEDEIGVDLLKRSPRGVTLTAEGALFLDEAREIISRADEAVAKTRALARGEYGTLNVGYAPSPSADLLPPALQRFQQAVPRVTVKLHDLAGDELAAGLRNGSLEIAIMVRPQEENAAGLLFEPLKSYPLMLAMLPGHPLAKARKISLEQVLDEKLVALRRNDYSDYHHLLDTLFAGQTRKPKIVAEYDSASSLLTAVESGRGLALLSQVMERIVGSRMKMRPLSGGTVGVEVGLCRAVKGDVTPAGEKFCDYVRKAARKA